MEAGVKIEGKAEAKNPALAADMRDAAKPIGDFVAQVASAICVLFCFLDFYTLKVPEIGKEASIYKGFETPYGIIILVCALGCFIFATFVMFSKLFNKDFWLSRSPGWVYMGCAGVIIVISVMAMVFPYKDTALYNIEYVSMVGCFFAGLFTAFGGLMKF